jgi:aminoglycoside/choline kinase family phosphotransferase
MIEGIHRAGGEPSALERIVHSAALRDMLDVRFRFRRLARWHLESANRRKVVCRLEFDEDAPHPSSVFLVAAAGRSRIAVEQLNREVAAMCCLRALGDERLSQAAPEVFAHDPVAGMVIVEDLHASAGVPLGELLQRPCREPAADALRLLAHTLGRLHAATFRSNPSSSSRTVDQSREAARISALDRRIKVFRSKLRRYGLALDARARTELRAAHECLYAGADHAFCHGDVSPSNVFVTSSAIRFCDFEFAAFHNPVLEGMHVG